MIDATVGGASANSFADMAYATAYFAARLYSEAWQTAQSPERETALLTAAAEMSKLDYLGRRVNDTQALPWPRVSVQKPDLYAYYDQTEIPKQIKDAQCEWTIALLESQDMGSPLGNVTSLTLGPIKVDLKKSAQKQLPVKAAQLLRGLALNLSGVPIVRG